MEGSDRRRRGRSEPVSRPRSRGGAGTADSLEVRAEELLLTVPAEPREARRVRQEVERWLVQFRLDERARCDIVLALGEAVANSIEHGCEEQSTGAVSIAAQRTTRGLRITVRDNGRWRPPSSDSSRGRGVLLMRKCVDRVEISTTKRGTTVVLEAHLMPATR